jgi:tetratricopeptide (TPR) repeat protein
MKSILRAIRSGLARFYSSIQDRLSSTMGCLASRRTPSSSRTVNFSFSGKVFLATTALMMTCSTIWAGPADELISKGDNFDLKLRTSEALDCYLAAEKLAPESASLLVRIARQYRHLMADATTREEKRRLGNIGLDYALRASVLAPNDSEAQLSPAISYGKMVPFQGIKEQTESARHIKDAVDKAIQLDPQNDLAWDVLGRWNKVLADVNGLQRAVGSLLFGELPTGSNVEAVSCFQKAIEINPNRLMHYIELGQTYAQMGKTADARRLIAKGLAMPDIEKDDPETKRRGRETLAKLP